MKIQIKDRLTESHEEEATITLSDFKVCVDGIYYHLQASTLYSEHSRVSQSHLRVVDQLCVAISDCFDDEDNFMNWLHDEPCRFQHPVTGKHIELKVRMEYEAIYYLLKYCMLLKHHKPIEDEILYYLSYVLCEPAEKDKRTKKSSAI